MGRGRVPSCLWKYHHMVSCQSNCLLQLCWMLALDPLHCPLWQLNNKLLQHHSVDDIISVTLFCQQPPLAGVSKLLGEGKQAANLTVCQYVEVLWGAADLLQNSLIQVQIHQQVGDWEHLSCELGFP